MKAVTKRLGVVQNVEIGYTNRGTWAVNLWLGSGQESHAYWWQAAREAKREARRCSRAPEPLHSEEERARTLLADRLLAEVARAAPIAELGLYSDLLRLALAEVDWDQVAERFLDLPE